MSIEARPAERRRRQLAEAMAEEAEILLGLEIERGESLAVAGTSLSLLVRPMPGRDLLVGFRVRGERGSGLADAPIVLTPADSADAGMPIRYGLLSIHGQLWFRGLETARYTMTLRPPWWLDEQRIQAMTSRPETAGVDLALVTVGERLGRTAVPTGTAQAGGCSFRSADGSLTTTFNPQGRTTTMILSGPVGDRELANAAVWYRAGGNRQSGPRATVLRWNDIERRCQAQVELKEARPVALPHTLRPGRGMEVPAPVAEPQEIAGLVAIAIDAEEHPDSRVSALRRLRSIAPPTDDVGRMVAILGDSNLEVRVAAATLLGPKGIPGSIKAIEEALESDDGQLRLEAAEALHVIPFELGRQAVIEALRSGDLVVRRAAGQALPSDPPVDPRGSKRTTSAVRGAVVAAAVLAATLYVSQWRDDAVLLVGLPALMALVSTLVASKASAGHRRLALSTANWLARRILRSSGVPPRVLYALDADESRGSPVRIVYTALRLLWEADVRRRRHDATLRFGRWLLLTGVGVSVVALLGRSFRFPWAGAQLLFGLATCGVGYYLSEPRNLLRQRDEAETARRHPGRHRMLFASSLIALGVLGLVTSSQFRPSVANTLAVRTARGGMLIGALLAAVACLAAFLAVTIFSRSAIPRSEEGQVRRSNRRLALIRWSTRPASWACFTFAGAHVLVAASFAPTRTFKVALIVTAGLLCLVGREGFHDPCAYIRPVLFWFDGRTQTGMSGLAALEEAVRTRRRVVAVRPAARSELATALHRLALRMGELGHLDEQARAVATEAANIRRELVETDESQLPELASSLHLLGLLFGLDDIDEAQLAATEAVRIRKRLAKNDPAHRVNLQDSEDLVDSLGRGQATALYAPWVLISYSAAA